MRTFANEYDCMYLSSFSHSGACKFRRKSSMPAAVNPHHGRLLEKPNGRVARRHSCAQVIGIAPPIKHEDCETDCLVKPSKCNCTFWFINNFDVNPGFCPNHIPSNQNIICCRFPFGLIYSCFHSCLLSSSDT